MKKINLFFGSGASKGIWEIAFLKTFTDKYIKTKKIKIDNIYANSAGNWASFGLLYEENDLLCEIWKSYDDYENKLYTKSEKILDFPFTWENSTVSRFYDLFVDTLIKNKRKPQCNYYSSVFNNSKMKTEWLSLHDKNLEEAKKIMFASSSMQILYPSIKINEENYSDAGLLEFFLLKDFLKKHKNEINIVLTISNYSFIFKQKNTIFFNIPNHIKNKISFMNTNKEVFNEVFTLSEQHGKNKLKEIENFLEITKFENQ